MANHVILFGTINYYATYVTFEIKIIDDSKRISNWEVHTGRKTQYLDCNRTLPGKCTKMKLVVYVESALNSFCNSCLNARKNTSWERFVDVGAPYHQYQTSE